MAVRQDMSAMAPPPRRRSRVHDFQFFAGPPSLVPTAPSQPIAPVYLPRRRVGVNDLQFYAGPSFIIPSTAPQPVAPEYLPRHVRAPAHAMQSIAKPRQAILPIIQPYGEPGAATFILSLEPGTKVVYSWSTDIFTSYSGLEQRSSPFGTPRQRFEGVAFLLDAASRATRGALQRAAARGATFLLALPYEELEFIADSLGTIVLVATTTLSDWLLPGQRVAIIAVDGTRTITAVVQEVATGRIRLDIEPKELGRAGGRIMPLIQVLLDPSQGFARYPVAVDLWSLRAQASIFGWTGFDVMGFGALFTLFGSTRQRSTSSIRDNHLLVWDRPNAIEGTATESMLSQAEMVDLGALVAGAGAADVPSWARPIRYRSSSAVDWQWIKGFLWLCRGRQRSFLLSTNRDDLVFIAATADGILVGAEGDYTSWFASQAHRRLALQLADGSTAQVEVLEVADNRDGTLSLALSSTVVGDVAKISFLELVRLESTGAGDDFEVTWDGATFGIDWTAVVVQG